MDTDETQIHRTGETFPSREVTQRIIGAAYEVYHELGYGFLEKVYENALAMELRRVGLNVVAQAEIEVKYKGEVAGIYYADLLVDGKVICEIKSGQEIAGAHQAQLLNYLKATGIKVGLILNFGPKRVDVKRMVF
ncbi:MAG: GxxExxY protein [Dehalococcoidia bacterium]